MPIKSGGEDACGCKSKPCRCRHSIGEKNDRADEPARDRDDVRPGRESKSDRRGKRTESQRPEGMRPGVAEIAGHDGGDGEADTSSWKEFWQPHTQPIRHLATFSHWRRSRGERAGTEASTKLSVLQRDFTVAICGRTRLGRRTLMTIVRATKSWMVWRSRVKKAQSASTTAGTYASSHKNAVKYARRSARPRPIVRNDRLSRTEIPTAILPTVCPLFRACRMA